jgi:hypothetical protein
MNEKAIEAAAKTIPALIEKLSGLKGPDREVDAEIATAALGYVYEKRKGDRRTWFYAPDGMRYQIHGYDYERLPRFTASLDAVTALIMREMPNCLCDMNTFGAAAIYPNWLIGDVDTKYAATAETPALALLIAFLEAKMEAAS